MEYAALDAAVLIHIFHHLHGHPQYAGNIKDEQTKVGWKSHIVSTKTTIPILMLSLICCDDLTSTFFSKYLQVSRMGNTKVLAKASSWSVFMGWWLHQNYCKLMCFSPSSLVLRVSVLSFLAKMHGWNVLVGMNLKRSNKKDICWFSPKSLDVVDPRYSPWVKASHVNICFHVNRQSTDLINS